MSAPALVLRDVSKTYPKAEAPALRSVSLSIAPGECLCLLGPNGAGKTTLTSIVSSRVRATAGAVEVSGLDVAAQPHAARRRLSVVPQADTLDRGITVEENLVYHGRYFGMARREAREHALRALRVLGIENLAARKTESLSGGQVQKVTWARALVHDPDLILLDEPSTGLDVLARRQTHELALLMKRQGKAVLLTTHDMHEAALLADRIAVIDEGRILAQGSKDVLMRECGLGAQIVEISCSSASRAAEGLHLLTPSLAEVPGVLRISRQGAALFVGVDSVEAGAARTVIERAAAAGIVDLGAAAREPTLEDVFMALVGER